MKKSRLFFTALTTVALILTTSLTASAETSSKIELKFSDQKKLSANEMSELRASAIPAEETVQPLSSTSSTQAVAANTNVFYEFEDLQSGHYIESINSLSRSSTGTIYLTLVQWPTGSTGSTVLYYRLVTPISTSPAIKVAGNYTSTNKTISWSNMPAGDYKVQITNSSEAPDADGNGYTT